jgi:RNA polymerase sigma-70 factor (ECF subfamily)
MTQQDPRALAERAARRDTEAFAELYEAHLDLVYRSVYFKVGDATIAEDLTADVFAKAWEKIDSYQWRNLPFHHWLLRIASNTVIDHYRSRRRTTTPIDELFDMSDDGAAPDESVLRDLDVESLRFALLRLPDEQRDVLI